MFLELFSVVLAICSGILEVQCNCGRPLVSGGRVINGFTAQHGAWPWQILLKRYGTPECGGSIIHPNWIVTAAHCVDGKEFPPNAFSVVVGEHNWNTIEGTERTHVVTKVIKYGTFTQRTFDNDIALLKVDSPIQYNKFVSPVCLPTRHVPVGMPCYITGWGKIAHPGQMHYALQQARMPVVQNEICSFQNRRFLPYAITKNMVCSGDGGATRTSGCHGDSGGPFVCQTGPNGAWELHGAVSHGSLSCSSFETFTVHARILELKAWIEDQMRRN